MSERITPDQVVNYHTTSRGISVDDIGIAPLLIVSWMKQAVDRIARALDCRICKHWKRPRCTPWRITERFDVPTSSSSVMNCGMNGPWLLERFN
ncbi:MAG: hypothetical protein V1929_09985 [bacterium]